MVRVCWNQPQRKSTNQWLFGWVKTTALHTTEVTCVLRGVDLGPFEKVTRKTHEGAEVDPLF